jgi:hypothetical protein
VEWLAYDFYNDFIDHQCNWRVERVTISRRPVAGNTTFSLIPIATSSTESQEVLGYCQFGVMDTSFDPGAEGWCLEISATSRCETAVAGTEYGYNVLVFIPTSQSPNRFRRIGMGVIWHRSHLNEKDYGEEAFRDLEPIDVSLV